MSLQKIQPKIHNVTSQAKGNKNTKVELAENPKAKKTSEKEDSQEAMALSAFQSTIQNVLPEMSKKEGSTVDVTAENKNEKVPSSLSELSFEKSQLLKKNQPLKQDVIPENSEVIGGQKEISKNLKVKMENMPVQESSQAQGQRVVNPELAVKSEWIKSSVSEKEGLPNGLKNSSPESRGVPNQQSTNAATLEGLMKDYGVSLENEDNSHSFDKKGKNNVKNSQLSANDFMNLKEQISQTQPHGGSSVQNVQGLENPLMAKSELVQKPKNLLTDSNINSLTSQSPEKQELIDKTISFSPAVKEAGVPAFQTIDALVTKGASSKNRLTTEALNEISSGVHRSLPNGGGEIRVKLRPDNLGEIHLRVQTKGNEVSLKVMTDSDATKQILEDSLGSLKDSLSSKNLQLAKVDFTSSLASTSGLMDGSDQFRQDSSQNSSQNSHDRSMSFNQGQEQRNSQGSSQNHQRENHYSQNNLQEKNNVFQYKKSPLSGHSVLNMDGRLDMVI